MLSYSTPPQTTPYPCIHMHKTLHTPVFGLPCYVDRADTWLVLVRMGLPIGKLTYHIIYPYSQTQSFCNTHTSCKRETNRKIEA